MKVSAKNIIALVLLTLTMAACAKKEKELTPAQINARADSIVRSRMKVMRQRAQEDLDRRLPIELKPKIDSLLNVPRQAGPVPVFPGDEGHPALPDTPLPMGLPNRMPVSDTQR